MPAGLCKLDAGATARFHNEAASGWPGSGHFVADRPDSAAPRAVVDSLGVMRGALMPLAVLLGVATGVGRDTLARTTAAPPPGMVHVPAGEFLMGDDAGEDDERPARPVLLDGFYLDRTEVTQGDYGRCVAAGACAPATRYPDPTSPSHPAVGVSWHDAAAYCRFARKRLPTEAEWEKAARSLDGRRFPWGGEPDCTRANYGNFQGEGACQERNPGHPVRVGSYPEGRSACGADDLAGNVWEWVADWYEFDYYGRAPRHNPPGPPSGEGRALRGGACCSMFVLPRAANRLRFAPSYRDADIGFRCARDEGASRR
jgi:formylglycine-generating enzyme required for sulfatase activity